jgi:hypothetical protein
MPSRAAQDTAAPRRGNGRAGSDCSVALMNAGRSRSSDQCAKQKKKEVAALQTFRRRWLRPSNRVVSAALLVNVSMAHCAIKTKETNTRSKKTERRRLYEHKQEKTKKHNATLPWCTCFESRVGDPWCAKLRTRLALLLVLAMVTTNVCTTGTGITVPTVVRCDQHIVASCGNANGG